MMGNNTSYKKKSHFYRLHAADIKLLYLFIFCLFVCCCCIFSVFSFFFVSSEKLLLLSLLLILLFTYLPVYLLTLSVS